LWCLVDFPAAPVTNTTCLFQLLLAPTKMTTKIICLLNFLQRRKRRDVDGVDVHFGSKRLDGDNDSNLFQLVLEPHTTTTCFVILTGSTTKTRMTTTVVNDHDDDNVFM
jgi:hypothetical protein